MNFIFFFLNLHARAKKNIFLPITKRASTSLSFMGGLRNGHELEAFRLIGFKLEQKYLFLFIYIHIYTYSHTHRYLASRLQLLETQIEKLVLGKSQLFHLNTATLKKVL